MTESEVKAVRFIENIKNHAMVTLDLIVKEEPNVSPLFYKGREEKANTILAMVEEVQKYRAIGTPEECEAAREKQMPKRPKEYEDKYYGCPTCGNVLLHKWEKYPDKLMDKSNGLLYCLGCGQKLDWSDEE